MTAPRYSNKREQLGFTLVELLVSMLILVMLMIALVQITGTIQRTTSQTTAKIDQFREARDAFEAITRRLSQATLNTYNDIDPSNVVGGQYVRASELRFISGNAQTLIGSASSASHPTHAVFFQAPFGYVNDSSFAQMETLLNTWGFFIEWGSDANLRPSFLPTSIPLQWRFRLMEMAEPSDSLSVYKYTSGSNGANPPRSKSWTYPIPDKQL